MIRFVFLFLFVFGVSDGFGSGGRGTEWIGHMGARGEFVQNTKEAFEEGVRRGYFALEMDLRVSSDGFFYICHDDVFRPYLFVDSGLHGKRMGGYKWEDLKDLEIRNRRNNRTYYSKLARFEEYLEIIRENDVRAIVELKWTNGINNNDTKNVGRLVDLVRSYGVFEKTVFMTSMKTVLEVFLRDYPEANLMFLSGSGTTDEKHIEWVIKNRMWMAVPHRLVSEEIVGRLHSAGVKINAYTVNSEADAERLRGLGVDFITTDDLGSE